MVDDVNDDDLFDGAKQAYVEFCNEQGAVIRAVGSKAGVFQPSSLDGNANSVEPQS
jgi:hypothetical protein